MTDTSSVKPRLHFYLPEHSAYAVWIEQTFVALRGLGLECDLVRKIPAEGIVIAHTRNLPKRILPGKNRFLVCVEADRGRRPFCQFHIQQNPLGTAIANNLLQARLDRMILGVNATNHFVNHWPQPNLIPRDPGRGQRVETLVFMGEKCNITPELLQPSFSDRLAQFGVQFIFCGMGHQWHDYKNVDLVLAVRDFSEQHYRKPASKLVNAWHAGVPAIVGPESAFTAERRSELDFIVARSTDEVIKAVALLKQSPTLWQRMAENGRQRAANYTESSIAAMWLRIIEDHVVPAYRKWTAEKAAKRTMFYLSRGIGYFDRVR